MAKNSQFSILFLTKWQSFPFKHFFSYLRFFERSSTKISILIEVLKERSDIKPLSALLFKNIGEFNANA
jgi:hypothetical protein